jgi:hypothetical protein
VRRNNKELTSLALLACASRKGRKHRDRATFYKRKTGKQPLPEVEPGQSLDLRLTSFQKYEKIDFCYLIHPVYGIA